MGVMTCSRGDCTNIMCDTYVDSIGYICSECQEEFKGYLFRNQLNPFSDNEIRYHLEDFMETDKGFYSGFNGVRIDTFFQKNTK